MKPKSPRAPGLSQGCLAVAHSLVGKAPVLVLDPLDFTIAFDAGDAFEVNIAERALHNFSADR